MEDTYYIPDIRIGSGAAPDGNYWFFYVDDGTIMGRRIWESDRTFPRLPEPDLKQPCTLCGVGADFVEVTDYGLIFWCSLWEAEAFYTEPRRIG